MKRIAILAISVSVLLGQSDRPARNSVTAIRHWSLTDVTRVAIEVTGDFKYRTDRLHNPERVYFDILDARPRFESRRMYSETINDQFLQRVRVAETLPGISRVVLDLAGPIEVSTSQLTNPNRLMIELRAGIPLTIPTVAPAPPPPAIITPTVIPPKPPPLVRAELPPPPKVDIAAKVETPKVEIPSIAPPVDAPKPLPETPALAELGKAARHTSSGDTSLVRALGLKLGRVVIDPGHGGHDQGTEGPHGLLEKDLVLDVAKRVGKLIEDRMGAEVIYTRTDDTFIPLEGRTALANDRKADLFLSIHANSSPVPRITGVETYYLNFASSKDAADLAAKENATSQHSIFELQDIVQKITLHDKAEESREFAARIQAAMYAFSAKTFPAEKNRGVKKAPFVVLIGATMPSVLAEIGFLTNTREESLLKKSDYRQKLAEALFRGISRYAETLSHFQVAKAQQ